MCRLGGREEHGMREGSRDMSASAQTEPLHQHGLLHGHCIMPTHRSDCTGSRAHSTSQPIRTRCSGRALVKLALRQAGKRSGSQYMLTPRDNYRGRSAPRLPGLYIGLCTFLLAATCISDVSTEHTASSSQCNSLILERELKHPRFTASPGQITDTDCEIQQRENNNMGHTPSPNSQYPQKLIEESTTLWVFGYGSLVWKTGFKYTSKQVGYINGFARRFWQGDTIHRGIKHKPGRVATLEEDQSSQVWGVAFELTGRTEIDIALEHLGMRECILGGYTIRMVSFHPRDDPDSSMDTLVFIANPENENYLGRASIEQLSEEVIDSRGGAGHNVEYVTRLADFFRQQVPDMDDPHLFALDSNLRRLLNEKSIDLNTLLAKTNTNFSYMYKKVEPQTEGRGKCICTDSTSDEEQVLISEQKHGETIANKHSDESQRHHTFMDEFPREIDLF